MSLFLVYPQLKKLNLEKNMIEGALPTSMAECKALQDLNLANNLIVGPVVHIHWGDLSNLQHLLLSNNKVGCVRLLGTAVPHDCCVDEIPRKKLLSVSCEGLTDQACYHPFVSCPIHSWRGHYPPPSGPCLPLCRWTSARTSLQVNFFTYLVVFIPWQAC